MKNYYKFALFIVGIFIVFSVIAFINRILNKQIHDLTKGPVQSTESVEKDELSEKGDLDNANRKILRIERKLSQEDYTESIVLINKEEVARYKAKDNKIFDESGHIPDGKVKFVNEWKNTYGFEYYRNGMRDGAFTEHYNNGNIKTEAEYKRGRLLQRKTYYRSKRK